MYYVYEWFIVETGEVIYVGKGTKARYKVRKHNRLFNEMIKRFKCESRIIKYYELEQDAFLGEYERVKELKERGEAVCNICPGGFGGTTEWWTPERRKEYSEHNVMKSEKQRERMSKNNPMKNKKISERVNFRKRKPVIINGVEYASVKNAVNELHVARQTIAHWCRVGRNSNDEVCYYKGETPKEFSGRYNKRPCKRIIYNSKMYEAITDCANELGVNPTTIIKWARRGFSPDGVPCRYANDTNEYIFKKKNPGEQNKRPIIVNGVRYPSLLDATNALGLKKGFLGPYLRKERKNNKYICEYDNQQPSRGNSDNSTPEGSTTNG